MMKQTQNPTKQGHQTEDFLPLKGIHSIQFLVGNAKQASYFYRKAFGLEQIAYSGPETGNKEVASYVIGQGKIRFVFSTPIRSHHPYADHIHKHGDGVYNIFFAVDDVPRSYSAVIERGAQSHSEPTTQKDDHGVVHQATIKAYGDTLHTFIDTNEYQGAWLPGYQSKPLPADDTGLRAVDHMVANVELGGMNKWVDFYAHVMGFSQLLHFDDNDISTEYSALMSKVMQDGTGKIKLPINEPADGKRKSQIEEYLDFYDGPGIQHVALITGDILTTVSHLKANGVEFLRVPDNYYDELTDRVGAIKEDVEKLRELGILVDRDEDGYLLQLFTKPLEDRPTLFFEIIQRRGSRGFGVGNFKALFEAIEREQALRGNL